LFISVYFWIFWREDITKGGCGFDNSLVTIVLDIPFEQTDSFGGVVNLED